MPNLIHEGKEGERAKERERKYRQTDRQTEKNYLDGLCMFGKAMVMDYNIDIFIDIGCSPIFEIKQLILFLTIFSAIF